MSLFLFSYFSVYGLIHLYIFIRIRSLIPTQQAKKVFAVFLLLMLLGPLGVRAVELAGYPDFSAIIAWITYLWMGFVFILIVFLAIFEILFLLFILWSFISPGHSNIRVRSILLKSAIAAALICTVYGFFEALFIQTEHVAIRSSKIPQGSPVFRVVQISDVHVGAIIGKWRLRRMLAAVNLAHPDILVATGDIVDGQIHRRNGLSEDFRRIKPAYGSYAVLGNHEFYVGGDSSVKFLQQSGFKLLRSEYVDVLPYLRLAGADDSASHGWGSMAVGDKTCFLPINDPGHYTILLKHRPSVDQACLGRFDLQLSGHVHKGQIFPFNFLTWISFPVNAGLNRLSNGGFLYVSRGTGTWGPPIRFLAPPEVTVFDIGPDNSR